MAGAEEPLAGTAARSDDLIEIAKTAIGAEVGLSAEQSRRLVGDSAQALRKDARVMAKEIGLDVDDGDEQPRDEGGRFATGDGSGKSINRLIREAAGRTS
jgi:hypothetical protein